MTGMVRSTLWLGFFALILAAWWMMYSMAMQMDLDLLGRPGAMGERMRQMDPSMDMYMPMARFFPLFVMWGAMMAAMMVPTMVPTLRAYEDLMTSANGTRAGWLAVLAGYLAVWLSSRRGSWVCNCCFCTAASSTCSASSNRVDGGGAALAVGLFQFTRAKEICHGVCHHDVFHGSLAPRRRGRLSHGAGPRRFCALLLGLYASGLCRRGNEPCLGLATLFCHRKTAPDRALRNKTNGFRPDPRRRSRGGLAHDHRRIVCQTER